MVLAGFQKTWDFSILHVVANVLALRTFIPWGKQCFSVLGHSLRIWRVKLEFAAKAYAWLIFAGFSIVPLLVLAQNWGMIEIFDTNAGVQALASN